MGLFKSAEQKQIEEKILVKKAINNIKSYINKLDDGKKKYISEAKQARLLGVDSQYKLARSGLSMVITQKRVAEQLLLTMEMSEQLKDTANITQTFVTGIDTLSKQITHVNSKLNFNKVHERMSNAMMDSNNMNDGTNTLLDDSNSMFADLSGSRMNDELDTLIDREMLSDESSLDAKMDVEISSILKKQK